MVRLASAPPTGSVSLSCAFGFVSTASAAGLHTVALDVTIETRLADGLPGVAWTSQARESTQSTRRTRPGAFLPVVRTYS